MSEVKVNKISPRTNCGTVTLGDSGDSFVIPSGATITNNGTQTGFGRTGTVDWDTSSIKTATFSAVSGTGYFCNTTGGSFTVNLPAGSAGSIVSIADYTGTFQTNSLTVSANGSEKIGGNTIDVFLNSEGQSVTLVYVDATEGWVTVSDSTENVTGSAFLQASGGCVTTCGNFKIHTFNGPGTFSVSKVSCTAAENTVGYMVVAGGGGGGGTLGGGGGAGGFREGRNVPIDNFTASPLVANAPTNAITVTATSYPITVGGGGAGWPPGPTSAPGTQGSTSTFSTISSAGGGGGGGGPGTSGGDGGSGGGGPGYGAGSPSAGCGNTPSTTPAQGQDGGNNPTSPGTPYGAGGGGGAGAVGANIPGGGNVGGAGGNGVATSITGSSVTRAGGGGGSTYGVTSPGGGAGGSGGGGAAKNPGCGAPVVACGTDNTGGGGGGTGEIPATISGGTGGSGIVVIRYKYQ